MNKTPQLTFHMNSLGKLLHNMDFRFLRQLSPDPLQEGHAPNHTSREVRSGHYVQVNSTPLANPQYVAHSSALASELGLEKLELQSKCILDFFSGNLTLTSALNQLTSSTETKDGLVDKYSTLNKLRPPRSTRIFSWATPYALSICGQEIYNNCPFGTGDGYGDGRAISILELEPKKGKFYEFQLKGAGQTPFCRGADGRAVLRSSVREFLFSEAMYYLGVPTAQSLVLISSKSERVQRLWYASEPTPSLTESRRDQFENISYEPNVIIDEQTAIATRVAPTFLRVGHLELYARRVKQKNKKSSQAFTELKQLIEFMLSKEYPEIYADQTLSFEDRILQFIKEFRSRLAHLISSWIRVGFSQGNMNSDNCALGGRTLDYGPCGFMERYDPQFNKWIGGGENYAFRYQYQAAFFNFLSCCASLSVTLGDAKKNEVKNIVQETPGYMEDKVWHTIGCKLGLYKHPCPSPCPATSPPAHLSEADVHVSSDEKAFLLELESLLTESQADYTIFYRILSSLPNTVDQLRLCFYNLNAVYADNAKAQKLNQRWDAWLKQWKLFLRQKWKNMDQHEVKPTEEKNSNDEYHLREQMRTLNPKYVPREWMLKQAYDALTHRGDRSSFDKLQHLFAHPYEEGTVEENDQYYRKSDLAFFTKGGVGFMS